MTKENKEIEIVLSEDKMCSIYNAIDKAENDGATNIKVFLYLDKGNAKVRPVLKRATLVGECVNQYIMDVDL